MRRFYRYQPSFEYKKANKNHTCIFCGSTIKKGTKYYVKEEYNKLIDKLLEQRTGYPIYIIKARTKFYFLDRIDWAFCSISCLQNFSQYTWDNLPPDVKERMEQRILSIVDKIADVITLMTSLEGKLR